MKSRDIERDTKVYTAIMKAYSRTKNTEMVLRLFDELVTSGTKPDKFIFNTLIYTHTNTGDIDAAFEAFRKMQEDYKIPPDPVTYRSLITVCGKGKNMERAKQLFAEVMEKFDEKDVRSFNALFDAYGESVDATTAETYLRECKDWMATLEEKGIEPEAHTYAHLIKLCGKAGFVDEATDYLEESVRKNVELKLTSFDVLVDALANLDMTDEMCEEKLLECFKSMKAHKLKPSDLSFKSVLDLFEKRGDVSKAFSFLDRLSEVEMGRTAPAFAARLQCIERLVESGAYGRQDSLTKLAEIQDKMKSFGISLTYRGYKAWFAICVRASDVERTFECWDDFTSGGRRPTPDMAESMIQLTLDHERVDDALQLLKFVQKEKKIPPTKATYESLLANCVEKGDREKAEQVFKYMQEAEVEPDAAIQGHLDALDLA